MALVDTLSKLLLGDLRNENFVSGNLAETIVWSIHGVSTML